MKANVTQGRIEEHGEGLGTATEDLVRARAREIALTNGRRADDFTEADLQQARAELEGAQNAPDRADQDNAYVPRDEPPDVSRGKVARTKRPADEQAYPDQLVHEGTGEAAHDQMRAGNAESRRRDANFEDQLPEKEG
jgi:hypothetical protein